MTKEQASLEIKIEVNAAPVAKTFRGTGNEAPLPFRERDSRISVFFFLSFFFIIVESYDSDVRKSNGDF